MYASLLQKSCLFIFLILCVSSIFSQEHDYIQFTTKDGLPTNYVYGVVEDDDGYIWAYTENGMAKFDGYTFKHFSKKLFVGNTNGIHIWKNDSLNTFIDTIKNISALYGEANQLFIGTEEDGLFYYNFDAKKIKKDGYT